VSTFGAVARRGKGGRNANKTSKKGKGIKKACRRGNNIGGKVQRKRTMGISVIFTNGGAENEAEEIGVGHV